jgi:hypothetical protein
LARVAKIGDYGSDSVGRGAVQRVGHEQKFHDAIVGRRTSWLNNEDVFAANVFVQLNANLTIGKLTDARVAEWEANVLRNCVCKSGISVTTEDHQIVCHE